MFFGGKIVENSYSDILLLSLSSDEIMTSYEKKKNNFYLFRIKSMGKEGLYKFM